jgi:NAD(P)H dehydrogenase (quinone)
MKIVITGASGPFGRATTAGLLNHMPADRLILVSRHPEKLKSLAGQGAIVRFGDFDDKASLLSAFAGGDKLLMISTNRVGQRMPQHANAVTAATESGIQHIHYTSFVGAVPDNPSLAVHDHRGTEQLMRESGMAWTALRNSQYSDFILAAGPIALKSGIWMGSAEKGTIAHVTRDDCVRAAVAVLAGSGHENKVYNITGPTLNTMKKVSEIVGRTAGKSITYKDVTDEEMYFHFDSLGIPRSAIDDNVVEGVPWCSDDMVSFERTIREGRFSVISDDLYHLTGKLGESLESFAQRHKDFFLSN